MAERYSIGMVLLNRGSKSDEARSRFAAALDRSRVTEPDETGTFEVSIECGSQEAALDRVWDAVAASGADDHIAFLEHPSLPDHWQHKAQGPRV